MAIDAVASDQVQNQLGRLTRNCRKAVEIEMFLRQTIPVNIPCQLITQQTSINHLRRIFQQTEEAETNGAEAEAKESRNNEKREGIWIYSLHIHIILYAFCDLFNKISFLH